MNAMRRWKLASFAVAMFCVLPRVAEAAEFYSEDLRIPMSRPVRAGWKLS